LAVSAAYAPELVLVKSQKFGQNSRSERPNDGKEPPAFVVAVAA
jgi:hypothetical protein